MKKISKKEAQEKYGVIVTGVNSLYTYYLTDDGKVIDSDGDIRYIPPKNHSEFLEQEKIFEKLGKRYGLTKEFKENGIL